MFTLLFESDVIEGEVEDKGVGIVLKIYEGKDG